MRENKSGPVIPVLVIVVGVGWLLTVKGVGGDINWVWTLALAVVGVLPLLANGIDKVSVVIGPFFLTASLFSLLRQTGHLSIDTEVPVMVIVVGVLLLIARLDVVPAPAWMLPDRRRLTQS